MPTSRLSADATIITGASAGLGRAMAAALLQRPNQQLLCISRRRDESLQQLAAKQGANLEQWTLDLSESAGVARRLSEWLAALRPDALRSVNLINNAALMPPATPIGSAKVEDLVSSIRVNLEAPMALTNAFLKATQGWACVRKVVLISSGLGRTAMAGQAPYCAAKAGLDHFARAVALEEAGQAHGARIVSLAPGVINTDMQAFLRAADPTEFPDVEKFLSMKSTGALDSPEEAARKVLAWLEREDFGQTVVADVRGA